MAAVQAACLPAEDSIIVDKVGPYELLQRLGAGGVGTVYRARHSGTAAVVAVKRVRVVDPLGIRSIRREIHALRRAQHRGVVQVFDEGIEAGLPWYAMELLEGSTVRRFIEDLWKGESREPAAGSLPSVLALVSRLCDALAFLHGEGLVHRDLKPDNIFVRAQDGQPVLVDFGFASRFSGGRSREPLDAAGIFEGSFGYMAPEQVSGDLVDARADLYALGCVFYEMLTGRPVFEGDGWQLVRHHLRSVPTPPSQRVDGLPPALDDLVLRLLAKNPRDRIGYAEDVSAAIERLAGGSRSAPEGRANAYLYRPGLAGRTALLQQVDTMLDETKIGHGRCVLVGGESGAGKTRLAMELGTAANRGGLRAITGECQPLEALSSGDGAMLEAPLQPFKPLLQAIADECRAGGTLAADAIRGSQAAALSLYEPSFASLAGPSPEDLVPEGPEARRHVVSAVLDAVRAFSEQQPLLIVIDDLQWADDLSMEVFSAMARAARQHPYMVIGTYRTEAERAALRPLLETEGAVHFRLGRLDAAAVSTMVGDMLAIAAPPEAFVRFLAEQSAGNPFFVAEYLRAATSAGLLGRDSAGRWQVADRALALEHLHRALPLPASLHELLTTWLSDVSPRARTIIELAAVLGREFDVELLFAGRAADDAASLEDMQELRTRRVLEEVGASRLRFTHDKLREIAYEHIPAAQRKDLHGFAARRIEGQGADPSSFGLLAHHWTMAEVDDKSFDYLERAGGHALRVVASGAAVDFFQRAIGLADRRGRAAGPLVDRARRAGWLSLLGEGFFGLGDLRRSEEQMAAAMTETGMLVPRSPGRWVALLLAQVGRQAVHLARPADAVVLDGAESAHRAMLARAASRLCECYYYKGDLLAVTTAAVLAVNSAEQAGRRSDVRRQYAQLGYMAGLLRAHPLARRYFQQSREGGPAGRDPIGFGVALYYESSYEATFCRFGRAGELADAAIGHLASRGDEHELQIARAMRTHVDYYTGQFEAALPRLAEMSAAARARSNTQLEAWSAYGVARSLIPLGRLDEAEAHLRSALQKLENSTDHASIIICRGLLAEALVLRGDTAQGVREAAAVLALSRGRRPAVLTEGHGYEGAAGALLGALEQGRDRAIEAQAREACALLTGFARLFPLQYPASLRCRGWLEALSKKASAAAATWERALAAAAAAGIPFESARIHLERGRFSPPGRERAHHLRTAHEELTRLGCTGHARSAERLRRSSSSVPVPA